MATWRHSSPRVTRAGKDSRSLRFAIVAMLAWAKVAARRSVVFSTAVPMAFGVVGLLLATFTHNDVLFIAAFCVSVSGIFTAMPHFWRLPPLCLTGAAAASGIALINSVSNVSGFIGPYCRRHRGRDRRLHLRPPGHRPHHDHRNDDPADGRAKGGTVHRSGFTASDSRHGGDRVTRRTNTALIVGDMQTGILANYPFSRAPLHPMQSFVSVAREHGILVVFVRTELRASGVDVPRTTPRSQRSTKPARCS
ncbi:hypothetical protein SANTM175S_08104 [Streptomyces antimycoticus]